jgi:hypothetical protein
MGTSLGHVVCRRTYRVIKVLGAETPGHDEFREHYYCLNKAVWQGEAAARLSGKHILEKQSGDYPYQPGSPKNLKWLPDHPGYLSAFCCFIL